MCNGAQQNVGLVPLGHILVLHALTCVRTKQGRLCFLVHVGVMYE